MKTNVVLTYGDKIYYGHNKIHNDFKNVLYNIMISGQVNSLTAHISDVFSINPEYSLTASPEDYENNDASGYSGIFPFASSPMIEEGMYWNMFNTYDMEQFSSIDRISNHSTYAMKMSQFRSSNLFSVKLSQNYYNNPYSTTEDITISHFMIRTKQCDSYTRFLPLSEISVKELVGADSVTIKPTEMLSLSWNLDFDATTSVINNIPINLNLGFKSALFCSIAFVMYPLTTLDYKLSNFIAYESSNGAETNNGLNCIDLLPYGEVSYKVVDGILTFYQKYKNTSNSEINIGSLLIGGGKQNDNTFKIPYCSISSKDLWGVDTKVIGIGEVIELDWAFSLV